MTFEFRLEREKAILVNEVALVQKERDDQLLMAENEKQEALHAAHNEKGTMLERLNKTQNDLENAHVEIDRVKREAFSRAEQDKVGLVYVGITVSVCLSDSICLDCLFLSFPFALTRGLRSKRHQLRKSYGGQLILTTQLIKPNYHSCNTLHEHSTTVYIENHSLYLLSVSVYWFVSIFLSVPMRLSVCVILP